MSDYQTLSKSKALTLPCSEELVTTTKLVTGENSPFSFTVVTITGKKLPLTVCPSDTIYHIKQLIYQKDGILIDHQRLVINGKELGDDQSVQSSGITTDCSLHLILRLRGGMFHSTSSRNDYLSHESIARRCKAMSMIRHMRDKYNVVELMDDLHSKLIQCSTDNEIEQLFTLIEKYYVE